MRVTARSVNDDDDRSSDGAIKFNSSTTKGWLVAMHPLSLSRPSSHAPRIYNLPNPNPSQLT